MATTKSTLTCNATNFDNAGKVVEVKSGYACNYLAPRGFVTEWTKGVQKQVDEIAAAHRRREVESIDDARESHDALRAVTPVVISGKVGTSGRLFGAISGTQTVEVVKAQLDKVIDHRHITIASPTKSVGDHIVVVDLHPEITAKLKVRVAAK